MLSITKSLALLSMFIFNQAMAVENVSIKGLSKDGLDSFYAGAAKAFESHGKLNYSKANSLSYEEKAVLNISSVLAPLNSFLEIKDVAMFKEGAVLTSVSLAQEDKLGTFKDICIKTGVILTHDDIAKAVNEVMEGEFERKHIEVLVMGAREILGEKYSC